MTGSKFVELGFLNRFAIVMTCALLFMSSLNSCTSARRDAAEGRVGDEYVVFDTVVNSNGRIISKKTYLPFDDIFGNCRCSNNVELHTLEFNDTAITLTTRFEGSSYKIIINTADSLFLCSLPETDSMWSKYEMLLSSEDSLINYAGYVKATLPPARYGQTGVDENERKNAWVASFGKSFTSEGLELRSAAPGAFVYTMPYDSFLAKGQSLDREQKTRKRLPPFLFCSIMDYLKYFGPTDLIEVFYEHENPSASRNYPYPGTSWF